MWGSFAAALLLGCGWLASRFIALDWQTGTRLSMCVDQGMAVFVWGDAPMDWSMEVTGHDPDQIACQWWFASYPHSFLLPLWLPALALAGVGVCLRPRPLSTPRDVAAVGVLAASQH